MEKSKQDLLDEIERLKKINESLVSKVLLRQEQSSSFKLFQQNATLETEVKRRTEELEILTRYFKNEHNILDSILRTLPGVIWLIDLENKSRKCFNLESIGLKDEKELQGLKTHKGNLYDIVQEKMKTINHESAASTTELKILNNESISRIEVTISSNDSKIPVVFIQDRTEFFAQKELIRQQELKIQQSSKLASLGEIASGVAHEINNPLAIINASVTLMDKMLDRGVIKKEEFKSINNDIKNTVERIAQIIGAMRNLSKESTSLEKEPVKIQTILGEISSLYAEKSKANNIDLRFKISPKIEDQSIFCNPLQFSQVLTHLLNNSLDAINPLEEKWIELEITKGSNMDYISITDSGAGIANEVLNKIFEPFFTTKELGKGTGLGLSISRTIMEKHGGEIRFDHTYPNTKFVLALPKI